MPKKTIPLVVRLWTRVECKSDGCWVWKGPTNRRGYGLIGNGGRSGGMSLTHRVSWSLMRGEIPQGVFVLHRCDNPPCVNPDHLFLGTHADNMADMAAKGRGHWNGLAGPRSPNAKLSEQDVIDIREARRNGVAYSVLASQFGVSTTSIVRITMRLSWKHLP